MSRQQLVFATTNPGKLTELRLLAGDALDVLSAAEIPGAPDVDEDQPTFEGNAQKKARAFAAFTALPALADDSGLCVDALDGRPGVLSARYAPTDAERIARLLAELEGVPDARRGAAFRCALCLALPSGPTLIEVGECPGRIGHAPRGTHGFGYDPIFELPGQGKTLAELTAPEKSALSHRGKAFARIWPHLVKLARGRLA